MRGSVTNNNGFWIGWLDLLSLLLQLQSIYNSWQWMTRTRCIAYWTTSVFPSTVTDLVLIYESVTSVPVVRSTAEQSTLLRMNYDWTELTSKRTEYRSPSPTVRVLLCFIRYSGNVLPNRCLAMVLLRVCSLLRERVFGEPLASNGLPLFQFFRLHVTISRDSISIFTFSKEP
jgi:hypothetical protein